MVSLNSRRSRRPTPGNSTQSESYPMRIQVSRDIFRSDGNHTADGTLVGVRTTLSLVPYDILLLFTAAS